MASFELNSRQAMPSTQSTADGNHSRKGSSPPPPQPVSKQKAEEPPKPDDPMADMPIPNGDAIEGSTTCFNIYEKLGAGSFGAVYRVQRCKDGKNFAMKCESLRCKKPVLKFEAKVMQLAMRTNSQHLLHFVDRGKIRGRFSFIVMRLVGKNLWDLRLEQPNKRYPIGSVMKIAEQTLAAVRDLHRTGFLHRDIKPPNFSIGRREDATFHTIYLLDYGLCRRFRTNSKDLRLPRELAAFRGTTRYASLGTLEKKEQSRKDDIESWWYQTLEFMVGSLPWKQCKGTERVLVRDYKINMRENNYLKSIMEKEKAMPAEQMKTIFFYAEDLEYASIPDYDYIHRELMAGAEVLGLKMSDPPSWDPKQPYSGPRYKTGLDFNPKGVDE